MNKYHFCTLFDSNYILQGMTMYYSLMKYCPNSHLYILAFDDLLENILKKENLENATVIGLSEFENERLLSVKKSRTRGEYCWTCSSSIILYILNEYKVSSCTYIDSDIGFFGDPSCLIEEMGENDVLITSHRYTSKFQYLQESSGKYCVQFVTIKNTQRGLTVLNWWVNKCLEWCYNRVEDGKFGDQKYLDYWPIMFDGVHELVNEGAGLAPWNISDYIFHNNIAINKKNKKTWPVIFYHFHGLKFHRENEIFIAGEGYEISQSVIEGIYGRYIDQAITISKYLSKTYNYEKLGLSKKMESCVSIAISKYLLKRFLMNLIQTLNTFVDFCKYIVGYDLYKRQRRYVRPDTLNNKKNKTNV